MSGEPDSAITFQDATVAFGGRSVVGPLNLRVPQGQILVLLGRSGSGKTTTLRLINALATPAAGAVFVEGRATTAWDVVRLRRSIGYVIQEAGLFPHFTVAENVALVPRLEGWAPERASARVAELLSLVGLTDIGLAGRRPHELSGGQRQRVGVARALAADPPILLCDEPFGAVDPLTRADLQHEFKDLVGRLGKTVVFVTHDVSEALRLADRLVLLEAGAARFDGSPDDFRRSVDPLVAAFRAVA